MSDNVLVSIITPSYNRLKYIKNCVRSIREQTYKNIEHIVIDGGSSDGTLEYLESLSGKPGFRYVSERDDGMYDAINKGLRLAVGQVIAYLNTDDRYFPWTVQVALEQMKDKGADVIFGDLCIVVNNSDSSKWYLQFYPEFKMNYYVNYSTIAQPTVFLQRDIVEKLGGFGGGFKLIADCDYWLKCAQSGALISHVDEVLALQIDHGETLREKHSELLSSEFDRLIEKYNKSGYKYSPFKRRVVNAIVSRLGKIRYLAAISYNSGKSGRHKRFISWLGRDSLSLLGILKDIFAVVFPGRVSFIATTVVGGRKLPDKIKELS
ncbi:MAG: glycosyltransferase family 2 protein [Candidatus Accumulibacter necessarius]|jgi:glycosyltransferase involved in cell wall biosynthesis|uniref:glycosyltransferase family 2 protein n=1 Tax=Candidatus Accumulibacter necessarius TaxID=2954386 RepID=UPI002FC2CAB4